jgi:hypothetical protein
MAPPPVAQITSVLDRMSTLQQLVSPGSTEAVPVIDSDIEFDAFGDAYQAALRAAQTQPTVASMSPMMLGDASMGPTGVAGSIPSGGSSAIPPGANWTPEIVAAASTGTIAAPGARPIGGYGTMPVPTSLIGFGNGRVPPSALTPIAQSGHRLYAPAAAAWDSLVAAAAADGVTIRITDSYRSYEQQVDLADRKGLYSQGGLAARPGTSNHGWGLAVDADVNDPRTLDWIRSNGPRFGFVEAVPREPWHWEFRPDQVR